MKKGKIPFLGQKTSKNGSKTGFFSSNGADSEIANGFWGFRNPVFGPKNPLFGTFGYSIFRKKRSFLKKSVILGDLFFSSFRDLSEYNSLN